MYEVVTFDLFCGRCAYKEELSHDGWGGSTRVPNNDDYGTFEAPLNQENDDPVSDFLSVPKLILALLVLDDAVTETFVFCCDWVGAGVDTPQTSPC